MKQGRHKKSSQRGSGNKSKQFDRAILKDMGRTMNQGYMDSPGFQGPMERQMEQQLRKQQEEMYKKYLKDRNQAR